MAIRHRLGYSLAVIAAAIVAIGAAGQEQTPQQPTTDPKPAKNQNAIVVLGCLSGSLLTHSHPREYTIEVPESIRLKGSRAVRAQLKELNGHQVELTGVLHGMTNVATGALVKDTGKTKIYVGGTEKRTAEESFMDQQRLEPPSLDVGSVKDVAGQCQETKSE